jgi:hypothetical protein
MTKVIQFPVRALAAPVCTWPVDRTGRLRASWRLADERWFAPVTMAARRPAPARRPRRLMPRLLARAA